MSLAASCPTESATTPLFCYTYKINYMNCPHCGVLLSERGFFCKACAAQARCMKCREVLESGAIACVECGRRIDEAATATDQTPQQTGSSPAANRNTFSYHED